MVRRRVRGRRNRYDGQDVGRRFRDAWSPRRFYLVRSEVMEGPGWSRLVGALGLAVAALWWFTLVDASPKDSRPYVGSSATNSASQLAFERNGVNQVDGTQSLRGGAGRRGGFPAGRRGGPGPGGAGRVGSAQYRRPDFRADNRERFGCSTMHLDHKLRGPCRWRYSVRWAHNCSAGSEARRNRVGKCASQELKMVGCLPKRRTGGNADH